ncbi:MAG: hypothetical protein ACTHKJ_05390 [Candidatus Nitrosocosmicus sp.]
MKTRLFYLLALSGILTIPFIFNSLFELAYSQQRYNSLALNQVQNVNLTMGKPIYVEKFEVPKSDNGINNNNSTSSSSPYSFVGNGTLNGLKISASGGGIIVPREDGTSSIKGHTVFVSKNGSASYSFEDIANNENNSTIRLGAAFFDANATGDLGFLKSKVGVYESHVDNGNRQGIFAMWLLKGIQSK